MDEAVVVQSWELAMLSAVLLTLIVELILLGIFLRGRLRGALAAPFFNIANASDDSSGRGMASKLHGDSRTVAETGSPGSSAKSTYDPSRADDLPLRLQRSEKIQSDLRLVKLAIAELNLDRLAFESELARRAHRLSMSAPDRSKVASARFG